jgi:hypothetical protein
MLSAILNLAPLQGASFYRDVFRDFLSIHFGIVIRFLRSTNCTVYGDQSLETPDTAGRQRSEFCSETEFKALV